MFKTKGGGGGKGVLINVKKMHNCQRRTSLRQMQFCLCLGCCFEETLKISLWSYSSAINAIKKNWAGNLVMNWSGNSIKWQEKEPPNIDDMFYESYLNKKIGCLRSCYLWFVDGICPSQTPFETQERSIGQSAMETWRFRSKIIFLRWFCLFLDNMYNLPTVLFKTRIVPCMFCRSWERSTVEGGMYITC